MEAAFPLLKSKLNQVFGLDPRSLALFRVCVAALLLGDLVIRLQDFSAFYTEEGILPLALAGQYHEEWRWSLHFLSGSSGFQGMLFVLAGFCALALLAGWHARLAAILSWVLLVSLHARMPLVLNAGDSYLRLLLFWSVFLPLGKAWSLDALRRPQSPAGGAETPALSVAGAAILLQVCIVYWYSGLAKLNEVWLGGNAMGPPAALFHAGEASRPIPCGFPGSPRRPHQGNGPARNRRTVRAAGPLEMGARRGGRPCSPPFISASSSPCTSGCSPSFPSPA